MRTEIQNRICSKIMAGTFYKVTYTGKVATKTSDKAVPTDCIVNEVSGEVSESIRYGARDVSPHMVNWQFEATIAFSCEVDFEYFLTTELKYFTFTVSNVRVRVKNTGMTASHPPRQGSHNGTQVVLNLTVDTRS